MRYLLGTRKQLRKWLTSLRKIKFSLFHKAIKAGKFRLSNFYGLNNMKTFCRSYLFTGTTSVGRDRFSVKPEFITETTPSSRQNSSRLTSSKRRIETAAKRLAAERRRARFCLISGAST